MKIAQKLSQLRMAIDERVLSLIYDDYVMWGLPYYDNPGDTLIWEGTIEMLKKCPHKCLATFGCGSCKYIPLEKNRHLDFGRRFFWRFVAVWVGKHDGCCRPLS